MKEILLSSSASTRISLKAIREGNAGLNAKRRTILDRVPNSNDWAAFPKDSISIKDIAYLAAASNHEFALLRGKTKDIVFHGTKMHCNFNAELLELLKCRKLRLIAHTHTDYEIITPSADDRRFLRFINQTSSVIVSCITGDELEFTANPFE